MTKDATKASRNGILVIPFSPFYGDPLPIGTKCEIINEEEDRYNVKFPDKVGYSGSFHIKKTYVKED